MKELSIEEKAKRYGKAILWCISTVEHEFGCKVIDGFAATELKSWLEKQGTLIKHYEDKLDRCACENFNKGYKKALEKQGEKKPIFEMKTPEESLGIDSDTYNKIVDECIYGEQKLAWSEEDEKQARQIERIVHNDGCTQKLQKQIADWLKFLKERYTWKPSDEQMNTFEQWLKDNQYKGDARYCYPIFESLYQDLKKLKGE